jgi:hypothetical protein
MEQLQLAPINMANCSAKTETPPEPRVKNVSPAVARWWPVSAPQAVTAAHGNIAASSKDRWLGTYTRASHCIFCEHAVGIRAEPVAQIFRPP